jgi:hypothetical protein
MDQFMAMRHLRHVEALEPEHFRVLAMLRENQLRVPSDPIGPDLSGVKVDGVAPGAVAACVRDLDKEGLAVSTDPNAHASIRAPGGDWLITITPEGREILRFVRYMGEPD